MIPKRPESGTTTTKEIRIELQQRTDNFLREALNILREFVADIDAVGLSRTKEEWPDLVVTYRHAKKVLKSGAANAR